MKRISLLLSLALCLSLSGCAATDATPSTSSDKSSSEITSDVSSEESSEESSEKEDSVLSIGETGTLKNWEITVTDFEFTEKIESGYIYFSPDEGNQYALITITITNKGKEADTFMPSFNMGTDVSAKIEYDTDYTYSPSNLIGYSDDLHDSSMNPLVEKTGKIAFSVPNAVADGSESLILTFSMGISSLSYTLR